MLKNIKVDKCPICGCTEVIEEFVNVSRYDEPEIQVHSNGERWEHREFLCGYRVEHIPNFMDDRKTNSSECFYDPEVMKRKEKAKKTAEIKLALMRALEQDEITEKGIEILQKVIDGNKKTI